MHVPFQSLLFHFLNILSVPQNPLQPRANFYSKIEYGEHSKVPLPAPLCSHTCTDSLDLAKRRPTDPGNSKALLIITPSANLFDRVESLPVYSQI